MKKKSRGGQPGNRNTAKDDHPRVSVTMRLPKDVRDKLAEQKDADGKKISQADTVTKLARKHL